MAKQLQYSRRMTPKCTSTLKILCSGQAVIYFWIQCDLASLRDPLEFGSDFSLSSAKHIEWIRCSSVTNTLHPQWFPKESWIFFKPTVYLQCEKRLCSQKLFHSPFASARLFSLHSNFTSQWENKCKQETWSQQSKKNAYLSSFNFRYSHTEGVFRTRCWCKQRWMDQELPSLSL